MSELKTKEKIFRDSVHGYITVPEAYCRLLIDTPLFQRLRHIEQTSMRCLYPSARHDRFVHSLGVYHLGCIAFDNFRRNISGTLSNITPEKWASWRHTFLIACLMHDCGHGPFSHTFEKYYDLAGQGSPNRKHLGERLADKAEIHQDELACLPTGSAHEKVSAILLLDYYGEAIKEICPDADPVLAARMITGWTHLLKNDQEKQIENILISLLNGPIDVDKLDYIIRDTWASGASNATVDLHRLLGAVCAGQDENQKLITAFNKSALSVLDGVFAARNHLYRWIYAHHKVQYDTDLLIRAVAALGGATKNEQDQFLCSLFSLNLFEAKKTINDMVFYRPSDGDLVYQLKLVASSDSSSLAYEWLSRKHKKIALWKSFAEFCRHFATAGKYETIDNARNLDKFRALVASWESANSVTLGLDTIVVKIKLISLNSTTIKIQIGGETVPYTSLSQHTGHDNTSIPEFFYAYIDRQYESRVNQVLQYVKENF